MTYAQVASFRVTLTEANAAAVLGTPIEVAVLPQFFIGNVSMSATFESAAGPGASQTIRAELSLKDNAPLPAPLVDDQGEPLLAVLDAHLPELPISSLPSPSYSGPYIGPWQAGSSMNTSRQKSLMLLLTASALPTHAAFQATFSVFIESAIP